MTLEELRQAYEAAWNMTDGAERRSIIEQCWAPDGVLVRTETSVSGHEDIAAHIDQFRDTYPDARVTVREMQERHGVLLMRIRIALDAARQGSVIDVVERGDDGRLKRVIVFRDTVFEN